jgi:hypothetical protein
MSITITIVGPKGAGKSIVAWAVRRALNVLGLADVKVLDSDPQVIGTLAVSEDSMYGRWHAWARNANLMHTPVIIDTQESNAQHLNCPPPVDMPILAVRSRSPQVGSA